MSDEPASGTKRVRQHPTQRRKQLIGIGLEMLTRRPLHQVTIDEVAAKAGISRSLLFHYFPTKRDYYAAVVRAASRRMLRGIMASEHGRPATLDDVIEGYLRFIERRHEPYLALFRSAGTDDWVHEIFADTRATLVAETLRVLEIDEPSALVRAAVGSWLTFAEELSVEWAHHRVGTRDQVLALLSGALTSIVALAARSAPE